MAETNSAELFSLKGRTAIVTGGTGIIGQHLVRGFASAGTNVAIFDMIAKNCEDLAARMSASFGVKAIGLAADLADRSLDKGLIEQVERELAPPDILINNAASKSKSLDAFLAPEGEFSAQTWREVGSVNLEAVYFLSVAFAQSLKRTTRAGAIINIASIYGHMSPDPRIYEDSLYCGKPISSPAVYAATKSGVLGLTRYMAVHWAPDNIRVNSVAPGGVSSGQNSKFESRYSARVPMRRMAEASEIVGPVLFLASPAASYVTGQNILVDGGLSAW